MHLHPQNVSANLERTCSITIALHVAQVTTVMELTTRRRRVHPTHIATLAKKYNAVISAATPTTQIH